MRGGVGLFILKKDIFFELFDLVKLQQQSYESLIVKMSPLKGTNALI